MNARIDGGDPVWLKSNAERAEPKRANERTDDSDPRCVHSMRDKRHTLPTAMQPCTLSVLPRRAKLRIRGGEPSVRKSKTEQGDPSRENPRGGGEEPEWEKSASDTAESSRAKERMDEEDPRERKSKAGVADPMRAEVRSGSEEPRLM